jgi:predicted dinucleotide-binding enzyme
MTIIGIIGTGNVGSNIARAAIGSGYDVVLANSRGPETISALTESLGVQARAATADQAAAEADFAVVAVPLPAVPQIPVNPLVGKVVISTINYIPKWFGRVQEIDDGMTTPPELLQARLPASRVVCAFTMLGAADMSGDGHPEGDPRRRALALAGNDDSAKRLVAGLYDQFGFDALDIGDLSEYWRIQPGQPAFVTPQNLEQLRRNVAKAKRRLVESGAPA